MARAASLPNYTHCVAVCIALMLATPARADPNQGQILFTQFCSACHFTSPGNPIQAGAGNPAAIRGALNSVPQMAFMRAFLDDSDIQDLADFLAVAFNVAPPPPPAPPPPAAPPAGANYGGIWWRSPAGSESGWGINFAHQGDTIFATWFTYDANGEAWWLTMTAARDAQGAYTGTIHSHRGPAFSATPFNPALGVATPEGTGTLTFTDADNGSFTYTLRGVTQTKAITKSVFASPVPACTFSDQANLAAATNYQDIWWAAPAGSESGWGVNFTHQGDVIYATWFTFDVDGSPLWLSTAATRTGPGVYTGTLSRYTGPPFSAVPWLPANVVATPVGTLTLTFAHGNSATFAYTVALSGPASAVTQSKPIVRTVFVPSGGAVCQ
jgi:hypothetical protein